MNHRSTSVARRLVAAALLISGAIAGKSARATTAVVPRDYRSIQEAIRAVASLRVVAGRYQDDRELAELIGELSMKSPEFAAMWSRHPVATCASGTKRFQHPEVGDLTLEFEVLHLPDDSGHRVLMYSAKPGGSSEAALKLLRSMVSSVGF